MKNLIALSLTSLALVGCANTKYCESPEEYVAAKVGPPLVVPADLDDPRQDTTFAIPDLTPEQSRYPAWELRKEKNGKVICPDAPPPIVRGR